ncbi:MAG: sugar phosphate isomerase/epimerase family protein [Isosphaeraceae bacterium]
MTLSPLRDRPLGTMIAYGFPRHDVDVDLHLVSRLGATLVEVLPDWKTLPDPHGLKRRLEQHEARPHSVHGCWGRESIRADRVDLGSTDHETALRSLDDLKRCVDWAEALGASVLVVHPGGFSEADETAARTEALRAALEALADHAEGTRVRLGVENMPPGVHPGSQMAEIHQLIRDIARDEVGLVVDTGHANLVSSCDATTLAAGSYLISTHVHDNNGRADHHRVPGHGTIDWPKWRFALDAVGYEGPIMLECIREIRGNPSLIDESLRALLSELTRGRHGREEALS